MKLALAWKIILWKKSSAALLCSTLICGHTGHRVVQHKAGAGVDSKIYF